MIQNPCRNRHPALRLRLVLFQQLAGDDQPLNLAGPFVDFGDAGVAVVPFGGHVRHVTHAAQDLDGLRQKGANVLETQQTARRRHRRPSRCSPT